MEERRCKCCGQRQFTADTLFAQRCINEDCQKLVYPSQEYMRRWKEQTPGYRSFKCRECFRVWTVQAEAAHTGECFDCGGLLVIILEWAR